MQSLPVPAAPTAPSTSGRRRPGLIVVGVLLLLGAGGSGFSTTVWLESRDHVLESRRNLASDAKMYGWSKKEFDQKVEDNHGFESEATRFVILTGGGALICLLAGIALIATGARRRPA